MDAAVDVLVAGGGPAGSAAAVTLRRLGLDVAVVDKATFPRDKCCGDGLTAAALRRLERLGLDPATVPSWQPVAQACVVAGSGRVVELPLVDSSGGILAASARRAQLDAAVIDLARRAGAEVLQGRAVTDVGKRGDDAVVVTLADGSAVGARYVIAADGMWSAVRRALGLAAGYVGEWQAGREYRRATTAMSRQLWVWFEPDMIPGYAWSFPLSDGTVNVGYGVLRAAGGGRGSGTALRGQRTDWEARPRICEVLGLDAEPAGSWRAWPIPARIGGVPLSGLGGRVLFAGDAAAACDPMTGEGIAQALETGELAARAVAQAGPHRPGLAAARYRRQVASGLALDDRLSRLLARVLARPSGADRALGLVDTSGWGRRHFARWMFEDYPRAVAATPQRWHRHMLGAPGAFAGGAARATGAPASVSSQPAAFATVALHD